MGLLDMFVTKRSYANKLVDRLGFEDASIGLYGLVITAFKKTSKFKENSNKYTMYFQMEQFVREEFDAASKGCDYSINFVNKICPDYNWYQGALSEDAEYPIDQKNGPQQILQRIIIPFIKENPDLAVKLRCRIVEMVYEDLQALKSEVMSEVSPISVLQMLNIENARKRLDRFEYLFNNGKLTDD